jgi:ribonuclease HI
MKKVAIYTDGSCLGNPGPGGWASLLVHGDQQKLLVGSEGDSTNNRMEMQAVLEGLQVLKNSCEVSLYVDSQYVMNAFTQGWLVSWKKKGWKTANRAPVKNQDLWLLLEEAASRHRIHWHWVKGHSGHRENEIVNQAAMDAAKGQWPRQEIQGDALQVRHEAFEI